MFVQPVLAIALVVFFGLPSLAGLAADPKQIYDEATNALYNLDFNTAMQSYEMLTREHPEEPDYWNGIASAIWLKITFDQQKLNLESFSGRTLGTKDSKDSVNPADEKHLRDTIAIAIQKSDGILSKHPNDVHALYAKGISNGILATFEATAKRSYVNAHSKAKIARDLHEQVLKLDPNYQDAHLAVGAYDYVVGVIPGFVRFLLMPFGIRSAGKEIGIEELETTATKGKNAPTDAKMILIVVYTREKRYDQAVRILQDLHMRYPRNFMLEMSQGSVYNKMHRFDEAERTYQEVLSKVQAKKDGYERLRQARVLYALATNQMDSQRFDTAMDTFNRVVSINDSNDNEKARSYLWLGKLFDSKKDRTKALQQYDALLALNCTDDLKLEAQRYKRRPFGE